LHLFNLNEVVAQLLYNPKDPLLFSSGFFVYFFFFFILLFYIFRKNYYHRAIVLTIFSLYFFYKASGYFVFLVIACSIVNFFISKWLFKTESTKTKKALLLFSIVFNLGVLFYFKYTNFFIEMINNFVQAKLHFLNLLLPIGISFYTFENLSYTIDVYRGEIKPEKKIVNYLLFLSFFPKLVMGPIVRAKDFIPQLKQSYTVSATDFSKGFYLILTGLFKKLIISDYISLNLVDYVFDGPALHNGFECLMALYGYAIVIYCDFSGYSDIAIGIAKWLGITIPPNFLSPYQSKNITEFWRRWHISLSSWLRDYLYIPLGGSRNGKLRTDINLFLTMFLGGLWHGASWNFLLWGSLHGVGLIINKIWNKLFIIPIKNRILLKIGTVLSVLVTFHFVIFCWIFFKANDLETSFQFINQIANNFTLDGYSQFLINYKYAIGMTVFGLLIHFIPDSFADVVIEKQKNFPIIYFVFLFVVFLAIYSTVKSATPVMPIYLQF
jgi:D-alanyl-lipoteichoic acid acyltransferase DltB (MBOAT superfamily)